MNMVNTLSIDERHNWLLPVLLLIVFGTIALPMLPIWQGAVRLLAGAVLIVLLPASLKQKCLLALLAALAVGGLAAWLFSLAQHPFGHTIKALTDVYGQPLGIIPDSAILLFDMICVFGLGWVLASRTWQSDRTISVFAVCLIIFWGWALLTLLAHVVSGAEPGRVSQMITGTSGWATWVYFAMLAILLVRNNVDTRRVLYWVAVAGLLVGLVVSVQWLVGDFSYLLDAPDFASYFYRVRGTDYYHTSATFALVLSCGVVLALAGKGQRNFPWLLASAVFLIVLVMLNSSRAMSLALASGLGLICLGAIRQKNHLILLIALLGCAAISTNVLYVKPVSGQSTVTNEGTTAEDSIVEESITAPKVSHDRARTEDKVIDKKEPADIKAVVAANTNRSTLAFSGLNMVSSNALIGSGVGTLELPLLGNNFNGLQSTYSTHTLFLDILLMAGALSFLAFLAIFAIPAWRLTIAGLVFRENDNGYNAYALLAVLAMFGIGCLFLPQERNELIGIAFLLAALAIRRPVEQHISVVPRGNPVQLLAAGLIVIGVAGWTIITSPAYVFPVIEFAARYGQSIKENDERVIVTEPAMKPLLALLLRLRGVQNPEVSVLTDSVAALPTEKTWVLWSGKRDSAYPVLRNSLGYQQYRQGGHAPSLRLPSSWWVVPNSQPMVNFVFVGGKPFIDLPMQELAKVSTMDGAETVGSEVEGMPRVYSATNQKVSWQVRPEPGLPLPYWLGIQPHGEGTDDIAPVTRKISGQIGAGEDVLLDIDGMAPGLMLALNAQLSTLPNRAYDADIRMLPAVRPGAERDVVDLNYGSATQWSVSATASLTFDFKNITPNLGVYRMVALNWRGITLRSLYSWTVEGSSDGTFWELLDKREKILLSKNSDNPSAFVLPKRGSFRYYRFRFLPSELGGDVYSGLMELELYPLP